MRNERVMNTTDKSFQGINRRHLILILVCLPLYFGLCLFLPAGTWTWAIGWLLTLFFVVASVFIFIFLWRVNPEVVIARSHRHEGTKRWDKILLWFLFPTTNKYAHLLFFWGGGYTYAFGSFKKPQVFLLLFNRLL